MEDKILFSIPGFTEDKYIINIILLQTMKKFSDKFYDDIKIDSIFDSFKCIFAGGRKVNVPPDDENIKPIINLFNSYNIQIRNVFTNELLTPEYFNDYSSNHVLKRTIEIGEQFNICNGCTINNPQLFEYIGKNYPELQRIWSTTLELSDIDKINELSKDNLVVVSYNFNNKWDLIDKFKYPQNIEFICTEEGCVPNCKMRKNHTLLNSYYNMNLDPSEQEIAGIFKCSLKENNEYTTFYSHVINRPYFINRELMKKEYLPRGFNKFKISGRTPGSLSMVNIIEAYVNFFVKPEHINFIRDVLLTEYLLIKIDGEKINYVE